MILKEFYVIGAIIMSEVQECFQKLIYNDFRNAVKFRKAFICGI